MSFGASARYVPHSETTRAHYEQLLRDLRRCLPPGIDDDLEEVAEQVLAIVCVGDTTTDGVQAQQAALERLLDTPLRREVRDQLLRYGRLLTDYVGGDDGDEAAATGVSLGLDGDDDDVVRGAAQRARVPRGVRDLDEAGSSSGHSGSHSSASSDSDGEAFDLITGMPRKQRRRGAARARAGKSLRDDKTLSRFAFSADGPGDVEGGVDEGLGEESVFEAEAAAGADWGAAVDAEDESHAPRITFDEVACNPHYVRDTLRRLFPAQGMDACAAQTARVVDFLSQRGVDEFTLETQLTAFLSGYDSVEVMDWIGDLRDARWVVVYGLRYAACTTQKEKTAVMQSMLEHARTDGGAAVERLYQSLTGREVDPVSGPRADAEDNGDDDDGNADADDDTRDGTAGSRRLPLRRVDLQACTFADERAPHRYTRATVPAGTQKATYETHDEVTLPPSVAYSGADPLVPLSAFPAWARDAFPGVATLNAMQSRVFDCAFGSDENMLVSAPTGAGKTNVAMMAMLRAVANATDAATGAVDTRELKMVYVAPMKALVQEVVRTFTARLAPLGLTVAELSGDSAMTQQQMAETQLIVTTPEKWDIVTRKSVELGVAALLKLLIIDEVHLLHNERGPVLEAIVARTMVQQQLRGAGGIRLVGLSATLPNYEDVGAFLQVDRQRGLFVFDSRYRPVPLEQSFCAVKRVKGMNQVAVMNRVVYDKVLQAAQDHEQTMIFVHSRKETEYTAMYLQKRAMEERQGQHFVRPGSEHEQALQEAVGNPGGGLRRSLQQLLPGGFAIHHAGLSRDERRTVEELFADRHIKVLVCTSTLAWGVNLPANRVIIKGTRVFNGGRGTSELLSALDVLQMFGRAGRVGFGASLGRATIVTSPEDLHYYLCVLNQQLPIESQMVRRVVDMLNAEIALGHVESTREGVRWLQRTYLYVRMRKVPEVYGVRATAKDPLLLHHLENIVHTACEELASARMADYERSSRRVTTTPYGRIASHCYVTAASMSVYLAHLSNAMQDVDLFRVFAMSSEFANLTVRTEEQAQLKDLLDSAPIAVRESRYTPLAKINILLQCYISRKSLEGLPLMGEMVYIKDSAQRILRALYEICLVREYGRTARQFLQLYTMVVRRQWAVESPIRQVHEVVAPKHFDAILPTLERVRVPWEELRQWSVEDLADRLNDDRRATLAHECIAHVPHLTLEAAVRPLARNMLYVDIDITPDFAYSAEVHGRSVCEVLLFVEAANARILHRESIPIPVRFFESRETYACPPIVVPLIEPKPTHLFIRCASPNWLACEATAAVCLLNMRLPAIAAPLRELDGSSGGVNHDEEEEGAGDVATALAPYGLGPVAERVFPFDRFFACQRALLRPMFELPDANLFAGVAPGGGKTVLAELFALQFLREAAEAREGEGEGAAAAHPPPLLLYVTSHEDTVERRFMNWRFTFGETLKTSVVRLDPTRSPTAQADEVATAAIVLTSGAALVPWVRAADPALRRVTHVIADHLHLLRGPEGRAVEECLARLQSAPLLVRDGARRARLLALAYPLMSSGELGRWLRVRPAEQFNFGATYRQLRARVVGLDLTSARARHEASVVAAMKQLQARPGRGGTPAVIFVPSAREAEEVARRLALRCRDVARGSSAAAAGTAVETDDARLGVLLRAGVGYLHRGTTPLDALTALDYLEQPATEPETGAPLPLLLVCAFDAAWRLPAAAFPTALICAAERLSAVPAAELASVGAGAVGPLDCGASELLQMVSRASIEAVVYCRAARRWVWERLLNEPLPLESTMRYPEDFADVVNAAVAQGRAASVTDVLRVLQSHYFLHHVRSNLAFYGLMDEADLPLFASDLAARVVRALRDEGCLTIAGGAEVGGATADEAGEDDPHAALHATPRGAAIAFHGITLASARAVTDAVARAAARYAPRGALPLSVLWSLLTTHCEELSAARLGDAARITDAAEYRALHTIARALPESSLGGRYVDLDFTTGATKVFLLVLAYGQRLFRSFAPDEDDLRALLADAGGPAVAPAGHPFRHAAVPPSDVQLLCAIPASVAARLEDDLMHLLPAAAHVVAAMVELLLPPAGPAGVTASLVALSHSLHRRTWAEGGAGLAQLPLVQAAPLGVVAGLASAGLTLHALQTEGAGSSPTARAIAALLVATPESTPSGPAMASGGTEGDALARLAEVLVAEARAVPRVCAFTAVGGAMSEGDGAKVVGGVALLVRVTARIAWSPRGADAGGPCCSSAAAAAAASVDADTAAAVPEVNRRWWLDCRARVRSGAPAGADTPLALRVITLDASEAVAGEWTVMSELLFPVARLEAVGDLDTLDVVATMTSLAYEVVAEAVVSFGAPP